MNKTFIFSILLSFSASIYANTFEECNAMDLSEADNVTRSECAMTLKQGYEKEVNNIIKKIELNNKTNKLLVKSLRSSQQSFDSYREEQCSYFFESTKDAPDGSGLISQAYCEAGLTRQRLDFLKTAF